MDRIEKIEFHPLLKRLAGSEHEEETMLTLVTIQVGLMPKGAGAKIVVDGKTGSWGDHIMGEGWMERFATEINELLGGNREWMELLGERLKHFYKQACEVIEEEEGESFERT